MKHFFILLLTITISTFLQAQNVGIGTTDPLNRLHIAGNMLVNTPTVSTTTAPTPAQATTMMNGINLAVGTDSTGRIYDPGGPSGNYTSNLTSYITIPFGSSTCIGIEITVESIQLGTGDSLIVEETQNSTERLLVVGNGYTTTGKWVFNSTGLFLTFKSNGDVNVGSGFSLLFRRIYDISSSLPDLNGVIAKALFFDTKKGALRSGLINNSAVGNYSNAMGYQTTASGDYSIAMGRNTVANGFYSTAMGYTTDASGLYSTAIGMATNASGSYSTAMCHATTASGTGSTAMGDFTTASGDYSLAMGANTTASGRFSTTMGRETNAAGYAATVIGVYNEPLLISPQTSVTSSTPLFIVGNGDNNANRSNAMVVLKNGDVGIGTPLYPAERLHVDGGNVLFNNSSNTSIQLQAAGVDKGFLQLSGNNIRIGANSGNSTANFIVRTNGADQFILLPNGNATLAGTLTQNSDARFKQNIQPLNGALHKLMQLNGYQYNWKPELKKDMHLQIGLIAQNVEAVYPELVTTNIDGMKSVAYQNLVPVLIEAIKEQQKKIDALNTRLEKLEQIIRR